MTTLSEALHEALSTDPRGCEHPPYMKPQCERIAAALPAPPADRLLTEPVCVCPVDVPWSLDCPVPGHDTTPTPADG